MYKEEDKKAFVRLDLLKDYDNEEEDGIERTFLEDFSSLKEILIQIRNYFKTTDEPNILEEFAKLEKLTRVYRFSVNELTTAFKLEKTLVYFALCIEYNPEENEILSNIVDCSMQIIKNLTRDKEDGYLLSFIDNDFISVASESICVLRGNRLISAIQIMIRMVKEYPSSAAQIFLRTTMDNFMDVVTLNPNRQIAKLITILFFYCTQLGAGSALTPMLNALEYLSGLEYDEIVPYLLYTASNITISRKVAICFLQFHNFHKMLNKSLCSNDFDVASAAFLLTTHICEWYYDGNHPDDRIPNLRFWAIVNFIDPSLVNTDIIEGALLAVSSLIVHDEIGTLLYNNHLLDRMSDVFNECEFTTKEIIALIIAKLCKKNFSSMLGEIYEHNGLDILLSVLDSYTRGDLKITFSDVKAPPGIVLGGLIYMCEFLNSQDLAEVITEKFDEYDTIDILETLSGLDNPEVCGFATLILSKLPDDDED